MNRPTAAKTATTGKTATALTAAAASLTLLGLGLTTPAPAAHAATALPPAFAPSGTLLSQQQKSDAVVARVLAANASKPRAGWTSVIVKILGGDLPDAQRARIKRLGGYVYRHLPLINSVAVRVPSRNLSRLAALPFVSRLSSDATVHKTDEFTVEHSGADVAFSQYNLTGAGVGVAVLDSGVRTLSDLNDPAAVTRLVQRVNFTSTGTVDDQCGHGTHVAGIIGGNGASSTGSAFFRTFLGVARQSKLLSLKVLDDKGQGAVSNVVSAINWAITNKTKYNIRVLNLSFGHAVGESYKTDPLCLAVEKAWKAGIVVVVAAGNTGRKQNSVGSTLDNEGYGTAYGSIQSPGNDPYVITVGAMKDTGSGRDYNKIATYSSRGPSRLDYVMKPDLVAPGNRVIATYANNTYLGTSYAATNVVRLGEYSTSTNGMDSNKYFRLSGTSMAAPVLSGAVALLLQKYPTLTPDTVKARLMISADKWTQPDGTADPCAFGAGYLNIPAALNNTFVARSGVPSLSPTLAQDSKGTVRLYADSTLDGTRAIWGTYGSLEGTRAIWGSRALWGSSTDGSEMITDANRALWGSSVWADRAVWGVSTNIADLSAKAIQGEN